MSSQQSNSRTTPDPEDPEVVVQQEPVIPVAELKATIAQLVKEALDEQGAGKGRANEKGRVARCLSVDFVAETTWAAHIDVVARLKSHK